MTGAPPRPDSSTSRTLILDELGRAGDAGALAHYADARYYTKTYGARIADVAYYVQLAEKSGGPVLEYGIGNGRVALPIARSGIQVTGVDLSEPMLADLAARLASEPSEVRRRVRVQRGDMCQVRLRSRFPLIIAPFNVLLHLYTVAEVREFLARVAAHLTPTGRFVFDVSIPRPGDLDRDPNRKYRSPRIRHPSTGELMRYSESFEYDPLRQILLVTMEFEPIAGGSPFTVPLTHRQFFPQELRALLESSGFDDIRWSADFTDLPPDENVDSLIVSCGRRGQHTRLAGRTRRA